MSHTHPLFTLSGKTALITGAGSPDGIGFATAALLAQLGCRVALTATGSRIHDRGAQLRATGAEAISVAADLTDASQVDGLLQTVLGEFGQVDILVNNAGMSREGSPEVFTPVADMTDAQWHLGIARNLDTCFLVTRRVLPAMIGRRQGCIVNVTSVTGPCVATAGESAYAAAKAAMVGFSRTLALEVAPQGLRVNCVAPGWVRTGSQTPEESAAGALTPMGRSATPQEIASAIAFLCMPAAAYIQGATLIVDGAATVPERHS